MILLFDMGLPMIMPTMYFMVPALIPIVLIESVYVARKLRISFRKTVGSIFFANLVSTLVGIPFTWGLLFLIQIVTGGTSSYHVANPILKILEVTVQAPWLLPFEPEEFWVFHSAAFFLLIPFFFATWLIEYLMVKNRLGAEKAEVDPEIDLAATERTIWSAVRNANLISYGLIALVLVLSLIQLTFNMR